MNRKKFSAGKLATALVVGGAAMVGAQEAHAVPAFARQLGVSCAACHTVEPQLTSFGRQFKSLGYTFNSGSSNTISYEQDGQTRLAIDKIPPIALMFVADYETSKSNKAAGLPSTMGEFPVQYSLFYAGRAATDLGVFSQLTYDPNSDHITIDNTDIRYAKESQVSAGNLVWGLEVNNSPAIGDLWQASPTWRYPFTGPNAGTGGPADQTILDSDALQQMSMGAGGYVWLNNTWYAQVLFYRSQTVGDQTQTQGLANNNPYWRLAYSHEGGVTSWEVGTYGMISHIYQQGNTGPTNKFTDVAVDGQYEHVDTNYSWTVRGDYMHESIKTQAVAASSTTPAGSSETADLNDFRVSGEYYWHRKYGVLGQIQTDSGKTNKNVWGGNAVSASDAYGLCGAVSSAGNDCSSPNGSPDTTDYVLQFNYVPWINTKFGVQYVGFTKFDGVTSHATDNNTLSFFTWIMM